MSNPGPMSLLLPVLLFFFYGASSSLLSLPDHYLLHNQSFSTEPQEYLDPTLPPLLPRTGAPSCSVHVLQHEFANTYGSPPASASFIPPEACPRPWFRVVLDLSVSCVGNQYDRIAAVWIAGAEVLRTSTAEPTDSGVFWRVRKDVTNYASLLRHADGVEISMMLENIVNDIYTGIYKANLSLEFYPDSDEVISLGRSKRSRNALEIRPYDPFLSDTKLGKLFDGEKEKLLPALEDPADLIIPVCRKNSSNGYWFRVYNQSDEHFARINIPRNTFRAVLEVFVSFHSNDEFWYSNPPDVYIKDNNLTSQRGNGAFREVFATIDGRFVGTVLPFPVIFTGGINPLFWAPVVAIGAFDLPSYNLDITPFLELLLDGKNHSIGLGVNDGISFWLLDANLHLWLDSDSQVVSAKLTRYEAPPVSVVRANKFLHLNGTFKTDAERKAHFSGWVNSSMGNMTTDVNHKFKIKSSLDIQNNGNYKAVHLKAKAKTEVKTKKNQEVILSRVSHKLKYPLAIVTLTLPGMNNTYRSMANLSHTLYEEATVFMLEKLINSKIITDKQEASGWMQVEEHSVLSGSAATKQTYQYRNNNKCYSRNIRAKDGVLLHDTAIDACALDLH